MRELLQSIVEGLDALNGSGNVRPDGQDQLNGLRVTAQQALSLVVDPPPVDPLEARMGQLAVSLDALSTTVHQLVGLANQAGAAQPTTGG